MSSAPAPSPAAAAAGGGAGGGGSLAKGGKPVVAHDKARSALAELMTSHVEEIIAARAGYHEDQSAVSAQVILSIDGLGYKAPDGSFSKKKPGKTKGKSSYHFDERSFLEQFYITVGCGAGFAKTRLVCVSNPVFFKDVSKGKLLGGHDPVLKPGDYVFTKEAQGAATCTVISGAGRYSGICEQNAITYSDLYAVIPKEQVKDWIAKGLRLSFS